MVHLTETCDAAAPRPVMHAEVTPADVHEAMRTGAVHGALAAKGPVPSEHLMDAGHVSGHHIVAARARHDIELIGPPRPDPSWQAREKDAFRITDFTVDWGNRRARCPEGRTSTTWGEYADRPSAQRHVRAGFSPSDCRPCPPRPRCTRGPSRRLGLPPRSEHEAVAAARARRRPRRAGSSTASDGAWREGSREARADLRPAPGAPSRPRQSGPAERRHGRGHEP
jgi:hypothetical protein